MEESEESRKEDTTEASIVQEGEKIDLASLNGGWIVSEETEKHLDANLNYQEIYGVDCAMMARNTESRIYLRQDGSYSPFFDGVVFNEDHVIVTLYEHAYEGVNIVTNCYK